MKFAAQRCRRLVRGCRQLAGLGEFAPGPFEFASQGRTLASLVASRRGLTPGCGQLGDRVLEALVELSRLILDLRESRRRCLSGLGAGRQCGPLGRALLKLGAQSLDQGLRLLPLRAGLSQFLAGGFQLRRSFRDLTGALALRGEVALRLLQLRQGLLELGLEFSDPGRGTGAGGHRRRHLFAICRQLIQTHLQGLRLLGRPHLGLAGESQLPLGRVALRGRARRLGREGPGRLGVAPGFGNLKIRRREPRRCLLQLGGQRRQRRTVTGGGLSHRGQTIPIGRQLAHLGPQRLGLLDGLSDRRSLLGRFPTDHDQILLRGCQGGLGHRKFGGRRGASCRLGLLQAADLGGQSLDPRRQLRIGINAGPRGSPGLKLADLFLQGLHPGPQKSVGGDLLGQAGAGAVAQCPVLLGEAFIGRGQLGGDPLLSGEFLTRGGELGRHRRLAVTGGIALGDGSFQRGLKGGDLLVGFRHQAGLQQALILDAQTLVPCHQLLRGRRQVAAGGLKFGQTGAQPEDVDAGISPRCGGCGLLAEKGVAFGRERGPRGCKVIALRGQGTIGFGQPFEGGVSLDHGGACGCQIGQGLIPLCGGNRGGGRRNRRGLRGGEAGLQLAPLGDQLLNAGRQHSVALPNLLGGGGLFRDRSARGDQFGLAGREGGFEFGESLGDGGIRHHGGRSARGRQFAAGSLKIRLQGGVLRGQTLDRTLQRAELRGGRGRFAGARELLLQPRLLGANRGQFLGGRREGRDLRRLRRGGGERGLQFTVLA